MVLVIGVRTPVILPVTPQQQSSDELVEVEQEELLHDDSLRRELCGGVCERRRASTPV
jgi:hypothetical protein